MSKLSNGSPAASGGELDARLLRLCAEHSALNNETNAYLNADDRGDIPDKITERLCALEAKIGLLPVPYTLPGVAALLRVKAAIIGTRWPDGAADRIVLLALNGLERLVSRVEVEQAARVTRTSEREYEDWRELPFVKCKGREMVSNWNPVDIPVDEDDHYLAGYSEGGAVGTSYALALITHSLDYGPDMADGQHLADVAHEIVKRGKWTSLEIGFFSTLGEFIEHGRAAVACGFDAVPLKDLPPVDGSA